MAKELTLLSAAELARLIRTKKAGFFTNSRTRRDMSAICVPQR